MAKRKRKGAMEPRDRGIFVTMNGSEVLAINQGTKGRSRDRWIVKALLAELKFEERQREERRLQDATTRRLKGKGML